MTDKPLLPENMTSRLRLLMLARVAIVTFLLGIAAFIDIKGMEPFSAISATALFRTIILTYILFILYLLLLKYVRNLLLNIYTQSLCDVLLITGHGLCHRRHPQHLFGLLSARHHLFGPLSREKGRTGHRLRLRHLIWSFCKPGVLRGDLSPPFDSRI